MVLYISAIFYDCLADLIGRDMHITRQMLFDIGALPRAGDCTHDDDMRLALVAISQGHHLVFLVDLTSVQSVHALVIGRIDKQRIFPIEVGRNPRPQSLVGR
ncbi:hypothetical protein D3C73_1288050 [compost metagenome]